MPHLAAARRRAKYPSYLLKQTSGFSIKPGSIDEFVPVERFKNQGLSPNRL
jgi:hypothetical protein